MHRFFVDNCNGTGENIIITGSDVNHIKNVLSDPYFMNKVREKFGLTGSVAAKDGAEE